MEQVIEVEKLSKRYGETVAVDGISFGVNQGEIFGILGPNGAGKTTTVESLIGLCRPDSGVVRVLGLNPQEERPLLTQKIGVQLQAAALADQLKVWEALSLFSSFYASSLAWEPLLEAWGLKEKRDAVFAELSGGLKQRLFITLALLNDPEIVFLDELTTGLDPQARRATWEMVRSIQQQGKTVVLVTHLMDEAEILCDRVAIVDGGKIVALDSPQRLIRTHGGAAQVLFECENGVDLESLAGMIEGGRVERTDNRIKVTGRDERILPIVVNYLDRNQIRFGHLRSEQPSLEDVFLALTERETETLS